MKLTSMTDFVLKMLNESSPNDFIKSISIIRRYAELLKQPLTLSMFVPCDDQGNVLEYQPAFCLALPGSDQYKKHKEYWKAEKKVLFKGFESTRFDGMPPFENRVMRYDYYVLSFVKDMVMFLDKKVNTVEDILFMDLELTESAIKQFT